MREFGVAFVEDDEQGLEGRDWAIVLVGRTVVAVVKKSRVCPEVLADAWIGFRRADGEAEARVLNRAS